MSDSEYTLRGFREEDAPALSQLTRSAIAAVGPHAYSEKQVAVWLARHSGPERFIERARGGHRMILAVDRHGKAAAYTLLEPDGHLDMLYCHPDHTRRGLADRLLSAAEDLAREWGLTRLYTEASDLARPAFERAGYEATERREFELDGVAIHNWAMEKRLG